METKADCQAEIKFIGLRIAYFRKLRNMTQAKLAQVVQAAQMIEQYHCPC